jgi:PAP2 superfamily
MSVFGGWWHPVSVAGDAGVAVAHALTVASLERSLHLFVERDVQHAALAVPGLAETLGLAYLSLHLALTTALLLWLHQRRPAAFALVRTTLVFASALALVGFLAYPTAPPRLAAVHIVDTVSGRHVDLNRGLFSSLYNPYAAVPSLHIGYALVVGTSLVRYARRRLVRLLAALYPPLSGRGTPLDPGRRAPARERLWVGVHISSRMDRLSAAGFSPTARSRPPSAM